MFILKHSKSSELILIRRIVSIKPGFRREDGWEKFEWTKNLTMANKKGEERLTKYAQSHLLKA
jgi:hypothetical protein